MLKTMNPRQYKMAYYIDRNPKNNHPKNIIQLSKRLFTTIMQLKVIPTLETLKTWIKKPSLAIKALKRQNYRTEKKRLIHRLRMHRRAPLKHSTQTKAQHREEIEKALKAYKKPIRKYGICGAFIKKVMTKIKPKGMKVVKIIRRPMGRFDINLVSFIIERNGYERTRRNEEI